MAEAPEEGFKVTDRRRRPDEERRAREVAPPEAPPRTASQHPREQASLVDLFMMFGSEAVIALGDAPNPATGQRERVLPHAAEIIDLLLLLRDKTEGNRTAEETQVLEELLYDLQLRYVRATKSAG